MGSDYYGFIEVKTNIGWKNVVDLNQIFHGDIISKDLHEISKKNGCPPNPGQEVRNCVVELLSPSESEVFKMDVDKQNWEKPDFDFSSHNIGAYWFDGDDLSGLSDEEIGNMSNQFNTALRMMKLLVESYGAENVRAFIYESY